MLFFQGSWYCTACGSEFTNYLSSCENCEGEEENLTTALIPQNQTEEVQLEMDLNIGVS